MGTLAGKVAIVTGGSSGIGAATVKALAAAGATTVIGYNSGQARAEALRAALPGTGHTTAHIVLEDTASITAAAEQTRKTFGRADILVNSAGFTRPVPHADLDALDDALIDQIMVANVRGPFAVVRAFAPLLRESGQGVIINVSSLAAISGSGSNIAYGASKAALDTMTISLARVLAPEIRVLSVSPGAVTTDFVAGRSRADVEKAALSTPLKRATEPEDVATTIMGCITHMPLTTGIRILIDGGRHL